jgi:hypothetical protein
MKPSTASATDFSPVEKVLADILFRLPSLDGKVIAQHVSFRDCLTIRTFPMWNCSSQQKAEVLKEPSTSLTSLSM